MTVLSRVSKSALSTIYRRNMETNGNIGKFIKSPQKISINCTHTNKFRAARRKHLISFYPFLKIQKIPESI